METAKEKTRKQPIWTADRIITSYMDLMPGHESELTSTAKFCKKAGIPENVFFEHFGSVESIREIIWVKFFENAMHVMNSQPGFESYSQRNKVLALHFTLFEIFTLNRGYILYVLKENGQILKNLPQLRQFSGHFLNYLKSISETENIEWKQKMKKYSDPILNEGAWLQFLFILKFWLDDQSKGFEKTDILIEKSVNTALDFIDTKPLENLLDLGKFLWKERSATR
ncbi:MAG: TetR/AcrR family transcriptional regulator [Proteobacteria bacterium]|nr:MAG: TetR/AcrR family transcriptional regulator [Pseudomonadota bacterium]